MTAAPMNNETSRSARLLDQGSFQQQLILKDRALAASAEGITISDPNLPDNPLIYANAGFERLTGYSVAQVLGTNCRFLQGPRTDPAEVEKIRQAVRDEREVTVELLNYRQNGSTFWNRLSITPIRNEQGRTTHFIGVQSDVTARRNAEEQLREANHRLAETNLRMTRDLEAASRIQQAQLPSSCLRLGNVNIAWRFRPCDELAGDMLNVFPLDSEQLGLFVLDVSGHGVPAALLSVTVSHWLSPVPGQSGLLYPSPDETGRYGIVGPAQVCEQLNQRFPMDTSNSQFFTLVYGIFNTHTLEFRYACAGHPHPIHVSSDCDLGASSTGGPPIGILPDVCYEESLIKMRRGDRLILYTDGIIETLNSDDHLFGLQRLAEGLFRSRQMTVEESVSAVMREIEKWRGEARILDDASILALEISP